MDSPITNEVQHRKICKVNLEHMEEKSTIDSSEHIRSFTTSATQSGNEVTTSTLLIWGTYIYPIKLCVCCPEQDINKWLSPFTLNN